MAFQSQIGFRRAPAPHRSKPFAKFRKTSSGAGGGTISNSVPLREKRIDIQIDEETMQIRIGENASGVSCGKNGSFSCSLAIFKIVGSESILLTDGGDGWWYGSYYREGNTK
ncbi:hypothetical protein [Pantoea sp. 3_1284]|uniref:hypothetical protein n=1 Tax=Pantoea sp. 3_1284 TaxID=2259618 RepID=UPI000DE29FD3|nr:hypothetical protein [Pantoea sp. 3_1284]RBO13337.1 hypothetical protein DSL62_08950 [Pantoea sp. 3_1284]